MYAVGDYLIDERAYEVLRGQTSVPVEPQVLELLLLLIAHRERVVSKEEIFEQVWKGRIVSESALSSAIKAARKLLGDDGERQSVIRTVYGRGFRFVADVRRPSAPEPPQTAGETSSAPPPESPPATRYAEVNGVHVAYQIFGAGPVDLVIVPGFVSNVDGSWDNPECARWLSYFAQFARVVVFDKRGTGLSDRVDRLPTMDERIEDVSAVMDAAGLSSAALLGISEGGSLACLFAASHPERCRALVLFGAFAQFPSWMRSEKAFERFSQYVRTSWGTGKNLPRFAPSMVGNAAFERWWGRFERLGASPKAVIDLMQMNRQIDIASILPSITVPTLVVHRRGDRLIDPAAGDVLASSIPRAELLALPSSDHLPWVGSTVGEELTRARQFLEGAPADREPDHVLATVVMIADLPTDELGADSLQRDTRQWRGSDLRPIGTEWVATFDAPGRALRFATSVCARAPSARVAVHIGEIRRGAEEVSGFAVTLTRAIIGHARPGAVVVSRTVTDLVAGSGIQFEDLGPHDLDDGSRSWHLYRAS
jgi:pimeloyl-ACP methyl ester carboxylesterase